jgi:bla regulator protein BlaR1
MTSTWTNILPAIANHLWQSTVFAATAGLLALALRQNRAGARYWLWLAASLKFLLPFSLLTALGQQFGFLHRPVNTGNVLPFAVEIASQPFTRTLSITQPAFPVTATPDLWFPILLALWLCGMLTVLAVWYVRWRRISAAIRNSQPIREGREWEALRRVQNIGGTRIDMLLSRASLEPGIFGIVRPVMVWPEGISTKLDDVHLEAILAHELWHVRRHDNLAASIHMFVEAVFWFHPLIWWVGARLVEERELACDEEVLDSGGERQVYAESILKVCEFCVGSPLACVAGVTGADLKKRIVNIMTKSVVRKLDFGRKLLLSVAGLVALALPVGFGVLHATPGRAESVAASAVSQYSYKVTKFAPSKPSSKMQMIKMLFTPEGFSASGVTVKGLLVTAYKLEDNQISGAPDWMNSAKFDIEATIDEATANDLKKLEPEQRVLVAQRMLQTFLAERFKLKVHGESKELPIYNLVVAPGGAKLQEARPGNLSAVGIKGPDGQMHQGMMRLGPGSMEGQAINISEIADLMSRQVGTKVVDKTGLTGRYDISLKWTTDESQPSLVDNGKSPEPSPFSGPALLTAIQEQLGLELQPLRGQVQILAIDHAEKPSEN